MLRGKKTDFLFVSRPVAEGGSSAEQDRGPAVLPERRLHHHRYPHRPQVRLLRGGKKLISSDFNP